ncbi:hypothetical protein OGAPHI_005638 [Ogataea philodendri]|uniref:Uncharacterized protein n=1 Tax=Ogataea philodendri TaxID=1378263 RepID=A0A9P8T1C2_9ASCO|nr:uncharacterized protein OGAPHI_005638 [Ogataea philodendri]KAH3662386.1 hypothetical protein OGAPHI_005638 [Ogataea philodendri]
MKITLSPLIRYPSLRSLNVEPLILRRLLSMDERIGMPFAAFRATTAQPTNALNAVPETIENDPNMNETPTDNRRAFFGTISSSAMRADSSKCRGSDNQNDQHKRNQERFCGQLESNVDREDVWVVVQKQLQIGQDTQDRDDKNETGQTANENGNQQTLRNRFFWGFDFLTHRNDHSISVEGERGELDSSDEECEHRRPAAAGCVKVGEDVFDIVEVGAE